MKNKVLKVVLCTAFASIMCTSCAKDRKLAHLNQVKNEQIGIALSHYFDSYARQPEHANELDEAKKILIDSMNQDITEGMAYGIAATFGSANNDQSYIISGGSGLFDAIARQPEVSEGMIAFEENVIVKAIVSQELDACAQMIGYGSSSLFDAIARKPESLEQLTGYATYIINSFEELKEEQSAYSIGYASVGFYDAVARQPEAGDDMFNSFKTYIETLK